jgi:hypothetical protein
MMPISCRNRWTGPAAVVFDQVVRTVEPEVPPGWLVVAGGEVDGPDNGAEQVLGVQRPVLIPAAGHRPAHGRRGIAGHQW